MIPLLAVGELASAPESTATSAPGDPHSGTVRERRMPELSDVALFIVAVIAIWLTRRALRRRMQKPPPRG